MILTYYEKVANHLNIYSFNAFARPQRRHISGATEFDDRTTKDLLEIKHLQENIFSFQIISWTTLLLSGFI